MTDSTVLVIDTNKAFVQIVSRLLEQQEGVTIARASSNRTDAVRQARIHQPDIIMLSIGQHSLEGLHLIPHLRSLLPDTAIVVLGSINIETYRQAAFVAGANEFVARVDINRDLLPTIRRLAGGSTVGRNISLPTPSIWSTGEWSMT